MTDEGLQLQSLAGDEWQPFRDEGTRHPLGGPVFDPAWERALAERHLREAPAPLPFQPLSLRGFMLYEQHAIDAARGLVRRFHPRQYRATRVVEAITRRPFPLFRPKPLFYRQPVYYMANHTTFVPSGTPVRAPSYSTALDFELELGLVLAEPLLDAAPDRALAAIGAFVLVNDLSARDVQRAEMASGLGPQKSKHFLTSMAVEAVTADEILPRADDLAGTVRINGQVVSRVSSAGKRWGLGELLAHASRGEQLLPGELLTTGTLPGGSGMETGHWLREGDLLELTVDGVGRITHSIVS
jgi:2-keto-4-pentenoate hydratase/2-oxohepta-3-ene-1,7-dioic acid hydratase in catechol pathway